MDTDFFGDLNAFETPAPAKKLKPSSDGVPLTTGIKPSAPSSAAGIHAHGTSPNAGVDTPSPPKTSPSGKRVVPIRALNPYNNNWTIRARVVRKDNNLRSFRTAKGESHVFNIELVDDEGTAIEATLWREFAALQHSRLVVDRVYFVTGGQLKVADKRYATVRNPYTMHLDNRTVIEDAPEEQQAAASRMAAKLQYVPFNDLPAFINSRTTVDILGVATQVAPLGSVKRKSDQTELTRRDVTLVDASKRSVTVTLWGDLASGFGAEIESLTHPVVSIAAVRVSDYNGLSLSTVTRSSGMANMDTPEARKLREWYDGEGRSADIVAANEGLAGARGAGEKGPRPVVHLSAINDSQVFADSKPEYYSVYARFLSIREDQSFYYLAAKEANNRKVVANGDGTYRCDHDGKTYEQSQVCRRYIMLASLADTTGSLTVNVFDNEAKDMLRQSADDFSLVKEGGDTEELRKVLAGPCLGDLWSVRLQVRPNEYQGEVRKRVQVANMARVDFARESRAMLERIQAKLAA